MTTSDLPKECLEAFAQAESALESCRKVYRGFRRQTLVCRGTPPPAESWGLGHCRLTALLKVDAHQEVLQAYPEFVYEDSFLTVNQTLAWCKELMTTPDWKPAGRSIGLTAPLVFSHAYEADVPYLPVIYPCHHFTGGAPRPIMVSHRPLLANGLPAYPQVGILANHRFGTPNDFSNSWLGEISLYIPSDAARILSLTPRRRSIAVKLLLPKQPHAYTLKIWARKDSTHHFSEVKVSKSQVSLELPFSPDSQVVFLLDKDGRLVDKKGDPGRVNEPSRDPRSPEYWMRRILDGEGQDLELKNYVDPATGPRHSLVAQFKGRHVEKLAIEMASFANTNRGDILVGVEDDGTVRGVDDPKIWKARVTEIAHNNIAPPLTPRLFVIKFKGLAVLGIAVERSYKCHLVDHVAYIRRNASCRAAQSGELDAILHPSESLAAGNFLR